MTVVIIFLFYQKTMLCRYAFNNLAPSGSRAPSQMRKLGDGLATIHLSLTDDDGRSMAVIPIRSIIVVGCFLLRLIDLDYIVDCCE
jgi:hypothetical protein